LVGAAVIHVEHLALAPRERRRRRVVIDLRLEDGHAEPTIRTARAMSAAPHSLG